jgi:hypothetical protein
MSSCRKRAAGRYTEPAGYPEQDGAGACAMGSVTYAARRCVWESVSSLMSPCTRREQNSNTPPAPTISARPAIRPISATSHRSRRVRFRARASAAPASAWLARSIHDACDIVCRSRMPDSSAASRQPDLAGVRAPRHARPSRRSANAACRLAGRVARMRRRAVSSRHQDARGGEEPLDRRSARLRHFARALAAHEHPRRRRPSSARWGDAHDWEIAKRREFHNDALIALTARRQRATLVTRNRRDFAWLEKKLAVSVLYV